MGAVLITLFLTGGSLLGWLVVREIVEKNILIWLGSYLFPHSQASKPGEPVHILFAFCDHFEPRWGKATPEVEDSRVDRWCAEYPRLARKHRDADGCFPKHSFFYPSEEYRPRHLEKLAKMCAAGFGEIEIHLHHDNDTAAGLRKNLDDFLNTLNEKHGAIARDPATNALKFAFIHGNWALDNSRKDGRWCGVNNELKVLAEAGCYADFTLPSAPSDTQTKKINSIYYASGKEDQAKSHNDGIDVEAGKAESGDLMIIQGPLTLNWSNRKFGIFPRIENSDIRSNSPPTKERVDLWVRTGIKVKKQDQWLFIKIHTHGAQEEDMEILLGSPMDKMFDYLEDEYNDGTNYILHYVSAREMYNIVKAAEAGEKGDPGRYRDYKVPKPALLNKAGIEPL